MARNITCDVCREEDATFMVSDLSDGTTRTFGNDCKMSYAILLCQEIGMVALPAELVPASMGGTLEIEPAQEEVPAKPRKAARKAVEPSDDTPEKVAESDEALDGYRVTLTLEEEVALGPDL